MIAKKLNHFNFRHYLAVLGLVVFFSNFAQASNIDTVAIDTIIVYHAKNSQENSWLHWEALGGEILSENPTQSDSVVVQWQDTGMVRLTVYEESQWSCTGNTSSLELRVEPKITGIKLTVANVFTPNEDKKNDYFTIGYNYPPQNFTMTIYNRWGNRLFETHDINYAWDGRIKGKYCNTGVYYYVIQYSSKGKIKSKKGFFHLFR